MAYQNVGTPRFLINLLEWEALQGGSSLASGDISAVLRTLPVNKGFFAPMHLDIPLYFNAEGLNNPSPTNGVVAILGHQNKGGKTFNVLPNEAHTDTIKINYEYDGTTPQNGFSIFSYTGEITGFEFLYGKMGSLFIGSYYDVPHSPDLNLTMGYEMDGVKHIRTRGGSDLISHKYHRAATWIDGVGAWELYGTSQGQQKLSRSGRRVWNLSFTHFQNSSVFPDTSSLTNYETTDPSGNEFSEAGNQAIEADTLLYDDSFFGQVIHKTNGGQLPFIFQPNKEDFVFAICKLDSDFKITQVANGVYNVKLTIREVW